MATLMKADKITKDYINILKRNKMKVYRVTCINPTAFVSKYNSEKVNLD